VERLRHGARRDVWAHPSRLHVQVREVDEDDAATLAVRLRERLEALPGVQWARYNAYLGRVVVEHDGTASPESIARAVEAVEDELCASARFARAQPAYPGDAEPEHRTWIEVAADTASLAISTALRVTGKSDTPHDIDFAAITAAVDGIPRIRKSIEQSVSRRAADLGIELLKTTAQIAVRSETGPLIGLVGHALKLRESHARRRAWAEREPELCGAADHHPSERRARKERPAPLGDGPIERYESGAIPISLGTFGAGLFFTRDVENSAPPLFAGLPRAARHGRSGFAAHLGWVLAKRGWVIFDGDVLRRLDRIDTVALLEEHAERDPAGVHRVARRARALELSVRILGRHPERLEWALEDEPTACGRKPHKAIRKLQRRGAGVLLICDRPTEGLRAADVGLALGTEPPPWGAHLVARYGIDDALLFLDALVQARRASEESVAIAVAEAATGLVISLAGLERRTTQRVMTLANASSLIALAHGVRLAHAVRAPLPAPPRDATPYHELSPEEVLALLGSRPDGLSDAEAAARARPSPPPTSGPRRFARALVEELASPITPLLGAGAGLSAAVGSVVDAGLILGALGINGVAGALQRFGARRAIDALESREERAIRVWREGRLVEVEPHLLVPGDVLELGAGEIVRADARLVEAAGLEVDESSLTGESLPVAKDVRSVRTDVVAERSSMIYEGTSIAAGRARAVAVAVGEDTEAGRAHASSERRTRPRGVEARLEELAAITGPVAGASALGIMAAGLVRDRPFSEVVTAAVGLGVAAVPEGLPILSTLAQLAAAKRLTRRGALVRNPRALEALGRVDVLCADKTGTLTEGCIRLALVSNGKRARPIEEARDGLRTVLAVALRASPPRSGQGRLPHPTDEALVSGAERIGVGPQFPGVEYHRGPELPFEPGRGFHASVGCVEGRWTLSVKGAPEVVLPRCTRDRDGNKLTKRAKRERLEEAHRIGRQGYRVLAVAERAVRREDRPEDGDVDELCFVGFVGLADPVRESARRALRDLGGAGVRVIMLTGDHPSTAEAIAHELGLPNDDVLTGAEMVELDDDALGDRIERCWVFARVTPAQKVRLVRVLAARGKTVAMTGDGANDAAAIALADVGIAVGAHATGAARSVADLVVTDGRIETIVDAILEGRAMWASVRDAVSILVGGNFGEIAFTLLPGLFTGRAPLNARQLLLVNLITDTLPSLAIAVAPPRREDIVRLLREGPEASLGRRLDRDLVTRALITGGAAATAYGLCAVTGGDPAKAGTVGLMALTGAQLGQTLVSGGRDLGVVAAALGSLAALLAVVEIPGLSHFFGCRPLGPLALAQAGSVTAAATGMAWWLPRYLERRDRPRPTREAQAAPTPPEPTLRVDVEDDGLFGGLLEAA
jgi:cation-transporting ATPase I